MSRPIYDGALNEVVRLFNDEGVVRAAAQAALDEALATTGDWETVTEHRFAQAVSYRDFDEFEQRMMRPSFAQHDLSDAVVARVRAAFRPHRSPVGARFRAPYACPAVAPHRPLRRERGYSRPAQSSGLQSQRGAQFHLRSGRPDPAHTAILQVNQQHGIGLGRPVRQHAFVQRHADPERLLAQRRQGKGAGDEARHAAHVGQVDRLALLQEIPGLCAQHGERQVGSLAAGSKQHQPGVGTNLPSPVMLVLQLQRWQRLANLHRRGQQSQGNAGKIVKMVIAFSC